MNTCDVIYSEDDEMNTGHGWYFQRWPDQSVSEDSYETKEECIAAARAEGLTVEHISE